MGTSLSGLTPATTFDGLLKVGDNDPLTADLKAISTGDGTDTILDLSTTAFKVSGETIVEGATTGQFFKVRNASNPTQEFYIEKVDDALNRFNVGTDTTYITYRDGAHLRFVVGGTTHAQLANTGDLSIGLGGSNATARLHVKGSGATSATTSLLVQDSAGSELFKLTDDGNINLGEPGASPIIRSGKNSGKSLMLGNQAHLSSFDIIDFKTWDGAAAYTEVMRITGNGDQFVGIGETTPTSRLHIKGSGNDNTTTALLVQNSDGTELFKIQDNYTTQITTDGGSSPGLYLNTGSGREGGDGGLSIGSDTTKFNINSRFGNGVINASSSLFLTSSVGIGGNYTAASSGTARLFVKGSGNDNTTASLLVQNSDGTEHLKVTDDGEVNVRKQLFVNHASISSRYLSLGWGAVAANSTGDELSLYGGGGNNGAIIYLNGSTKSAAPQAIGMKTTGVLIAPSMVQSSFAPTAQLHVKGSGNDATTTALLVENSAGTEALKVRDDGKIFFNGLNLVIEGKQIYNANTTNGFLKLNSNRLEYSDSSTSGLDSSAALTVTSTTRGFLPPRMTDAERDAIATPAAGLMIYDTTNNQMNYWNGSTWIAF